MAVGYRQKRWREAERLRVDVNATMAHMVAGGVEEAELAALVPRLADAHAALARQRRAGLAPFAELPYARAELKRTLELVNEVRGEVTSYLRELATGMPKLQVQVSDRLLSPKLAKELRATQDGVIVFSRGSV